MSAMMTIGHVEPKRTVHQIGSFSKGGHTASGGRWWEVHTVRTYEPPMLFTGQLYTCVTSSYATKWKVYRKCIYHAVMHGGWQAVSVGSQAGCFSSGNPSFAWKSN